jgi:hypothetical protein
MGPHSIEPCPQADFVEDQLRDKRAVDLDNGDSLEMAAQQLLVALDVHLVQLETVALPVKVGNRLQRLFAEVAPGPRVNDHSSHAAAVSPVAKASKGR